jgi:hypothetical protein
MSDSNPHPVPATLSGTSAAATVLPPTVPTFALQQQPLINQEIIFCPLNNSPDSVLAPSQYKSPSTMSTEQSAFSNTTSIDTDKQPPQPGDNRKDDSEAPNPTRKDSPPIATIAPAARWVPRPEQGDPVLDPNRRPREFRPAYQVHGHKVDRIGGRWPFGGFGLQKHHPPAQRREEGHGHREQQQQQTKGKEGLGGEYEEGKKEGQGETGERRGL